MIYFQYILLYQRGDQLRAISLGILASFFFAFTFVLNRSMELSGGSWIWSASLRFIFMLPFLFLIVLIRGNLSQVLTHMKEKPVKWFIWSFVGFGLFYAPLTFAASFGPGWLIAGTWQLTIIAGSLLIPFIENNKNNCFPVKGLLFSLIILLGIVLMQFQQANHLPFITMILSVVPIIVAAFAYPLGNRQMMKISSDELDTFQRVFGMTVASMPLWFLLSIIGLATVGLPSVDQTIQTFIVAVTSGILATVLFFIATDMVRNNQHKLAAVEATQSGEVVFALIGEVIFLHALIPSIWSLLGIFLVIIGMVLHSLFSNKTEENVSYETSGGKLDL